MTTRYKIAEQVLNQLKGGNIKAATTIQLEDIMEYAGQVLNQLFKQDHLTVSLPSGETIPNGSVIATYDNLVPVKYKNVSKVTLPATPIALPRNLGVFLVAQSQAAESQILGTPILGARVISSTEIDLYWGSPFHATNYLVERATDSNFTLNLTTVYSGTSISFNDVGLSVLTRYYYRITASANNFINSEYGYANAMTEPILQTPALSNSVISSTEIDLTWSSVFNANTYLLERALDPGFTSGLTSLYSGVLLAYNDAALMASTTYYYRVSAIGAGFGNSGYGLTNGTTSAASLIPAGVSAWYKADSGVTGTTSVTNWADQSSNGINLSLSNPTAPLQLKTNAINGLPTIKNLQTASNWGSLSSGSTNIPALTSGTVFIVAKQNAAEYNVAPFINSSNNFKIQRHDPNQANSFTFEAGASSTWAAITATNGVFYTGRLRISSSVLYGAMNNGTEVSGAISTLPVASPLIVLGQGDKEIAEIIIYARTLSGSEQTQVENYLRNKYLHY